MKDWKFLKMGVAMLLGLVFLGMAADRVEAGSCDTKTKMPSCLTVKLSSPPQGNVFSRIFRGAVDKEWTVQNSCPYEQRFASSKRGGGWDEHAISRGGSVKGRYMLAGRPSDRSGQAYKFECCKTIPNSCMSLQEIRHARWKQQQEAIRAYHRKRDYRASYGR